MSPCRMITASQAHINGAPRGALVIRRLAGLMSHLQLESKATLRLLIPLRYPQEFINYQHKNAEEEENPIRSSP